MRGSENVKVVACAHIKRIVGTYRHAKLFCVFIASDPLKLKSNVTTKSKFLVLLSLKQTTNTMPPIIHAAFLCLKPL